MHEKGGYTYIMSNATKRVLYIGVTSNLTKRIYEHKMHVVKGFTDKYNVDRLVYFEQHNCIEDAISREKQLKGWTRKKKIALIESLNPVWDDLPSF